MGETYEHKVEKEERKEESAGKGEMSRVKGVSDAAMPSSEHQHPHEGPHEAYKSTKERGMISSHDAHRDDHHRTMDAGEHKGMSHHVNKP